MWWAPLKDVEDYTLSELSQMIERLRPRKPTVARRMDAIQGPIIPTVTQLISDHPGTISLGQGMVSYGPPPAARARLEALWDDPEIHKYQAVAGLPELRAALAEKVQRENGFEVADERFLLVTAGSNMAFLQALLAIADPGDEVVLLAPFYFNHEMAIGLADCRPVVIPSGGGFQPDLALVDAAISERTRAVVSQHAALGALEAGAAYCRGHLPELVTVRDLVWAEIAPLVRFCLRPPVMDGAMYVFLELDTERSGLDLTTELVRRFGVAPLPGETFGVEDRCALRVSYGALGRDTVEEGVGRLVRGLEALIRG